MEPIHLFDSYYFREATAEEFGPFFQDRRSEIFDDEITMPLEDWMTNEEKQQQKGLYNLIKDRIVLRIFILQDGEVIGWHFGWQIDADKYYMTNTGIFKEYQGRGIYTALLPKLLEMIKEKGFQKATSRHLASNNAVLVPKLKAGFVITGVDIDERFGILVTLAYIFNDKRLKAYRFRTGSLRPDEELKKYL